MLCQRCKKNQATVHLTEIAQDEKHETHLCADCAAQEGVTIKSQVPLNELLTNFVMQKTGAEELARLTCPECGTSFLEFRNNGLLGCPHDYEAFAVAMVPLLERAHEGASEHVGKVPRAGEAGGAVPSNPDRELVRLRRELAEAVEREDYEQAAMVRDQIKACEQ